MVLGALAVSGLTGCGDQSWGSLRDPLRPSGGRPDSVAPEAPESPTSGNPPAGQGPTGERPTGPSAPIETYLQDGVRLPYRLAAESLVVRFRSNFPDVTFECAATYTAPMRPCAAGAAYDFGPLVHNQGYVLRVRAVRADGRTDETPLQIAFVADRTTGSPVVVRSDDVAVVPASPATLPASGGGGARLLQVGSYYGVQTPPSYLVTSYATTKNFNSALVSMRLTGRPELSSPSGARPCDPTYERPAAGPDALDYCEATPTRSEWQDDTGIVMPLNHLEIVRAGGTDTAGNSASEKLFVASYDASEVDATDGRMGIGDTCRSAVSRGETLVPLVYGFYEAMPTKVPFAWCQVSDRYGRTWWIGAFTTDPGLDGGPAGPGGASDGAPKLSVIYTADAQLGIFSGSQFAARAGDFIAPVLVPIAPTPDP